MVGAPTKTITFILCYLLFSHFSPQGELLQVVGEGGGADLPRAEAPLGEAGGAGGEAGGPRHDRVQPPLLDVTECSGVPGILGLGGLVIMSVLTLLLIAGRVQ